MDLNFSTALYTKVLTEKNLQLNTIAIGGRKDSPKTSTLIQFASSIVLKIGGSLTYAQNMP